MTVCMTKARWDRTHKDFKAIRGGHKSVVTETGIQSVEIVPANDERVDRTGYGRVA